LYWVMADGLLPPPQDADRGMGVESKLGHREIQLRPLGVKTGQYQTLGTTTTSRL
jgi:hypothetical protein